MTGRDIYKKGITEIHKRLQMANLLPSRLDEFCEVYRVSFFNLRLPCIFCKFLCTLEDLALFYTKNLSVVYRDRVPFACCDKCLKHTALYERIKYSQCAVKCSVIDVVAGKPLSDLLIRCMFCFALLDVAEKQNCLSRDEDFVLIRGYWRGRCRNCKLIENEGR